MISESGRPYSKRVSGRRRRNLSSNRRMDGSGDEDDEVEEMPQLTDKRSRRPRGAPTGRASSSRPPLNKMASGRKAVETAIRDSEHCRDLFEDPVSVAGTSRTNPGVSATGNRADTSSRQNRPVLQNRTSGHRSVEEQLAICRDAERLQRNRVVALKDEVARLKAAALPSGHGKLLNDVAELSVMNDSLTERVRYLERELANADLDIEVLKNEKNNALDLARSEKRKSRDLVNDAWAQANQQVEKLKEECECRFEKLRRFFKIFDELKEVDSKRVQFVGTHEVLQMLFEEQGIPIPPSVISGLEVKIAEYTSLCDKLESELPDVQPSDLEISSLVSDQPSSPSAQGEI